MNKQVAQLGSRGSPPPQATRRVLLALGSAALVPCYTRKGSAASEGGPVDGGEVQSTLNACSLSRPSCVSSYSDDEEHFEAPWEYTGDRADAIQRLLDVAQGGPYRPGLQGTPFGRDRGEVAGFILQGTFNAVRGLPPPTSPKPAAKMQKGYKPFTGRLMDKHTTDDGSTYVWLAFGSDEEDAWDAEFVFSADDDLITVWAASRSDGAKGVLAASLQGVTIDRNQARRQLTELRIALDFSEAAVISSFGTNSNKSIWFERLFMPFKEVPDEEF